MKKDVVEKIADDVKKWSYLKELPKDFYGFKLKIHMTDTEDTYEIYSYDLDEFHRHVTIYFHEETMEYKVRVRYGLLEFCRLEYVSDNLEEFANILRMQLDPLLENLSKIGFIQDQFLFNKKGFFDWNYEKELPEEMEGFHLFCKPSMPIQTANGTYLLLCYVDFSISSDVEIFYNIFRDEFFSEARIRGFADVSYEFDALSIEELEENLRAHLVARLRYVRARAEEEAQ